MGSFILLNLLLPHCEAPNSNSADIFFSVYQILPLASTENSSPIQHQAIVFILYFDMIGIRKAI